MTSDTQIGIIGIDLLQDSFHISTNEEPVINQLGLLPTALLPLYPGEKGIFGVEALNHRRAKGWQRPNECRMFWNNDSLKGCGRVTLAAAMQRLVNYHLTWGEQKSSTVDSFYWLPLRCKQILSSAEIIIGSLQSIIKNIKSLIALPLPDSSTQSLQQELLNTFHSRVNAVKNCGSKLFLLKRSIAQAMLWCKNHHVEVAKCSEPFDKQHVGHLIIINANMDVWEARLVPLQWHLWEGDYYLVPVDSAYFPRESLQVSGWQLLSNWLSSEGIVDESLWQALVGHELHYDQDLTPDQWIKISQIKSTALPHSSDLYIPETPKLEQIEQILYELQNRHQELGSEDSEPLGVIVDGYFANWFAKLDLIPLPNLAEIAQSGFSSLAAQGARLYAKNQSENLPTYLEELIPICIWCRNSNRYGAEFLWKPLISNTTVPAGKSSTLENCPGFILPAGQNEIQLILRRPSIDPDKDYEYRKIPAKIYEKFNTNVNVTITIEIKPGSGHAKARLLKDDGHLLSELNWKAMTECEKPSDHQASYLARTCEAYCDNLHWFRVSKELKRLKLQNYIKKNKLYLLEEPLEAIHDLFKNSRVKSHKNDCFLEYRVISSVGSVTSNNEQLELLSEFLEACYLLADQQNEKDLKKKSLQAMRHLFNASSKSSRKTLLKNLSHEPSMYELLCIGHSFCNADEIKIFFESFLRMEGTEIFYWLRAIRAILRYRYEAFDPEIIDDKLYQDLWTNVVSKLLPYSDRPKILSSAIQCLIYMLARRRFDKSFIGLNSSLNEDLNTSIRKLKDKGIRLDLLDQLEKLLNCMAAEEDIELLMSSEVNDI